MKFVHQTVVFLLICIKVFAQKEPACKCADAQLALAPDTAITALYDMQKAEKTVNDFVKLINTNTADYKKQFKENIYTRAAPCAKKNLALAVLCEGTISNTKKGRYILYDEASIDAIIKSTKFNTNAEWFILAHEVAHHICNHLHDIDYLEEQQNKLSKYQKPDDICKGKDCDIIKKNHIKELEADAVAVWLLKKSGVADFDIISMINKISDFVKIEFDRASSTHPSFFIRQKMASKILSNWNKDFANDKAPIQKSLKFVETEYEEILYDIDEQAKIYLTALENEKIAQINHFKTYSSLLETAKKMEQDGKYGDAISNYENALKELELSTYFDEDYRAKVTVALETLQKIIRRKVIYKIAPEVGLNYSMSSINTDNQAIASYIKPSFSYGIRLSRYHWQSPHWFDLTIYQTNTSLTTLTTNGNKKQAVEDFSMKSISTSLRYIFTNIGNKTSPSQSWKSGFIASFGPVLNYYFGNKYENYLLENGSRKIDVKPNVGAFVGIGTEKLSRRANKPFGNYRLLINYSFQNIRLGDAELTHAQYKIWVHQIGITLSYRQW